MGTMLYSKGIPLHRCFDELNLRSPQLVKEVHLGYVRAGAEVIETNTFGANRYRLAKFELADKVREINLAGAQIAREAAGEDLYVAGSVGPLDIRLEPLGPTSLEEARAAFREQIQALAEGGVDLMIIETMTGLDEAHQALLAAREVGTLPVIVQITIGEDGSTPAGARPEDFARRLDAWGADLMGVNCSVGPAIILEALERMAAVTSRKLTAQPNAGLPQMIAGRSLYLCSPEYMASYAQRFIETGARLVGGCCGTTPEHIKAIKSAVRSLAPRGARVAVETPLRSVQALEPVSIEKRSRLGAKLARGEFPLVIEITPPKGCDPARELEGAEYLRRQGIDAANIPDGFGSTARMSAQMLAALIQQKTGLEPLLHFSCRGRNLQSIQSDLLGASALGLRNIWAVTGDVPPFATFPAGTTVFDIDSVGLVNVLCNLNRGLDVGGNPLGAQTAFLIGVGLNPYALNLDEELRRFRYKVQAGANFGVIRPVFDAVRLREFLGRLWENETGRIPLLGGIYPLTSFRSAEFMNNEMSVPVPPPILERMRKVDTGDAARAEGVKIARQILLEIRGLVQGIQIAAPFGRYAMAVEVAQALGGGLSGHQDGDVKRSESASEGTND
jgi:methionine synthase I (cobalamin-dependent)/5,10-methylenetetrahydrofolate reductase